MRAIFISYRRDDAEGQAGRLFKDLVSHFGEGAVFMDVAGIEPGRDFRRVIDDHVASCGVLLALIGKSWLDAEDSSGRRRLEDPTDFVRLETASALKRDIPVVPVLLQGAKMPSAEQLPDDLKELAFRNGVELTHARWDSDVSVLAKQLARHVDATPTRPSPPASRGMFGRTAVVAALGLLGVLIAGWYFLPLSSQGTRPKSAAAGTAEATPQPQAPNEPQKRPVQAAKPASAPLKPIAPGTLLLHQFRGIGEDGAADWAVTGKKIGEGWSFKQVFAGDNGAIFAIKDNGEMLFHRFRRIADGKPEWSVRSKKIGEGWSFKQVFAGDNGAVYAIQDNGVMLFYRFAGIVDGTPEWAIQGQQIGTGWIFKQVFAGENGVIFAIQDNGDLLLYRFLGTASGTPEWAGAGQVIGTGWHFKHVFAGDNGAIFAVKDNGEMLFYRFRGISGGTPQWAVEGRKIGAAWNFKQVFAGDEGAIYAIQ
jgi:hypothetical protein